MELTHLNEKGEAKMVDISGKPETARSAEAQAVVRCRPETIALIVSGDIPKGDVFACARIAGIMAAKKTAELIPLCHQLPLTSVTVDISANADTVHILAKAGTTYKTGAEMEALTAAAAAALTVYDMCKAVDRGIVIENISLVSKTGGASGDYSRV